MDRDDGGPAFPVGEVMVGVRVVQYCSPGMTLRDYIAAHAPPMPTWFQPFVPGRPADRWANNAGTTFFFDERGASAACGFNGYRNLNAKDIAAWDKRVVQTIAVMWPYAWADMQIAERSK